MRNHLFQVQHYAFWVSECRIYYYWRHFQSEWTSRMFDNVFSIEQTYLCLWITKYSMNLFSSISICTKEVNMAIKWMFCAKTIPWPNKAKSIPISLPSNLKIYSEWKKYTVNEIQQWKLLFLFEPFQDEEKPRYAKPLAFLLMLNDLKPITSVWD